MLTGSLASAYYAVPRATQDIDLVVEIGPTDLPELTELLSSESYYISLAAAKKASANEGQFNAIDLDSGWKVDFIIRKNRPFSISEFQRRARAVALGMELYLATREDLVVAKLEWAKNEESELQLRDARAILSTAGPGFEWEYVERWVEELALGDQWEAVRPRDFPESDDPASTNHAGSTQRHPSTEVFGFLKDSAPGSVGEMRSDSIPKEGA